MGSSVPAKIQIMGQPGEKLRDKEKVRQRKGFKARKKIGGGGELQNRKKHG